MATLNVNIKHAGKTYPLSLDPAQPGLIFKEAVYQATGVPVDRMKIMVKGGMLKDDSEWKKIAPKEGQTFTVIGAAGELPKPPEKQIVFLEDMDDLELAKALAKPVGLRNLGNTCYMNATIQTMRAIPELQTALAASQSSQPLPRALRDLYSSMTRTTEEVIPMTFLSTLRVVNPQFAEMARGKSGMGGYAQQDAEECYGQIIQSLREVEGFPEPSSSSTPSRKFIDQFMMGEMRRELRCEEAPEEPPSISTEAVLKIECNISITTNFMLTGIMNSLDQKLEKNSLSLGRQAIYNQKSRLSRLPAYLTVHMVRFAWRADINKKAKIMRKVKFPLEFDALDLTTDELKTRMLPISRKLKEFERERAERRKVRKRTKAAAEAAALPKSASAATSGGDVEMADVGSSVGTEAVATTSTVSATEPEGAEGDAGGQDKGKATVAGVLEEESVYHEKEISELEALVDPDMKSDVGCSVHGLYDLVAIVTHKGAAADAGHYMGFVKKSVFQASTGVAPEDGDDDWYKFDDDKVSVFPQDKLNTLDGGGEDSSAYVLLYKSKSIS